MQKLGCRNLALKLRKLPSLQQWPKSILTWAKAKNQSNYIAMKPILVEAFGESKTLKYWEADERCKSTVACIRKRLKAGWDAEKAITTPNQGEPVDNCICLSCSKPFHLPPSKLAEGRRYCSPQCWQDHTKLLAAARPKKKW